jgi:hypothetical protein
MSWTDGFGIRIPPWQKAEIFDVYASVSGYVETGTDPFVNFDGTPLKDFGGIGNPTNHIFGWAGGNKSSQDLGYCKPDPSNWSMNNASADGYCLVGASPAGVWLGVESAAFAKVNMSGLSNCDSTITLFAQGFVNLQASIGFTIDKPVTVLWTLPLIQTQTPPQNPPDPGATNSVPGDSQRSPRFADDYVPPATNACDWSVSYLWNNAQSGDWLEAPATGPRYVFAMQNGALFTAISNFALGGNYQVEVGGVSQGVYTNGQVLSFSGFPGGGVGEFSVRGVGYPVLAQYPVQLLFSQPTAEVQGRSASPPEVLAMLRRLAPTNTTSLDSTNVLAEGELAQLEAVVMGGCTNYYQWKRNGTPLAGATGSAFTFTSFARSQSGSYTVSVSNEQGTAESDPMFIRGVQYSVVVSASGGTVVKTPDQSLYDPGTPVLLTATPSMGMTFLNWSGSISSTNNPLLLTVQSNTTLTATFVPVMLPAQTLGINSFDNSAEAGQWTYGWSSGIGGYSFAFDPAMDAGSNSASGSLRITVTNWAGGELGLTKILPGFDARQYSRVEADVFFASTSPVRPDGAYAMVGLASGSNWLDMVWTNALPTNGWRHIIGMLPQCDDRLSLVQSVSLRLVNWGYTMSGTTTVWLDNLKFSSPAVPVTSLMAAIEPAGPPGGGLEPFVTRVGDYQRQSIRTKTADYTWVGRGGPVTYSINLGSFPDSSHNQFEANLMVVGNTINPGATPDWYQPNVLYFRVGVWAGQYFMDLHLKTNAPASNAQFWTTTGTLAAVTLTQAPHGTFSLTLNGTTATITAPNGQSVTNHLDPGVLTAFNTNAYIYVGVNPGAETTNLLESALFSTVTITGSVAQPLVETFTSLDNWERSAADDPNGVLFRPSGAVYRISWPADLPCFVLKQAGDLTAASWFDFAPPSSGRMANVGPRRISYIAAPSGEAFFRLQKNP